MVIYSINDLINKDFDDEEIDVISKSLQYSLIVGMFNYMKINMTNDNIIKLCKTDNWYTKYQWTELQRKKFNEKLIKIFYNLYRFGPVKCKNSADEWIMKFGFDLKQPKSNKKKYKRK